MSDPPAFPIFVHDFGPVDEGDYAIVQAAGRSWLVARIEGALVAVEDLCGHQPRPLAGGELDGKCIRCPHHGVVWDLTTGHAADRRGFDSIEPLQPIRCVLEEGTLRIG